MDPSVGIIIVIALVVVVLGIAGATLGLTLYGITSRQD